MGHRTGDAWKIFSNRTVLRLVWGEISPDIPKIVIIAKIIWVKNIKEHPEKEFSVDSLCPLPLFGSWPWYRSNRESWWDRSPSHGSFFAIPVLQAQAKHGESTRSSLAWNMLIYVVDIGHVTQRSLSNTLTWPVTPWTSLGKTDRMRFPRQVALIATADPSRNWSGTSGDQRRCSKKSKNKNIIIINNNRRKFRSQTSGIFRQYGQMKKQRWEESEKRKKKEDQRKSQRKKMQAREKIENSQNAVFFQWFVAPKGREVGSLTRRVQSDLVKWRSEITCHCGAKKISKSKY